MFEYRLFLRIILQEHKSPFSSYIILSLFLLCISTLPPTHEYIILIPRFSSNQ